MNDLEQQPTDELITKIRRTCDSHYKLTIPFKQKTVFYHLSNNELSFA